MNEQKTKGSPTLDRFEYVPGDHNPIVMCKTCQNIVHYPKATCKATHIHCEPCISNSTACPTCGKSPPHFTESPFATEILEEMNVFCSRKPHGCKWQGMQKTAMSHLMKECVFHFCPRKARGCSFKGTHNQTQEHEANCDYALIYCPHKCEAKISRNELESHYGECEVLLQRKREEEQEKIRAAILLREQQEVRKREAARKLEEKRRKVQEDTAKKVISDVLPQSEDIISLNVGGTLFYTSKHLLEQDRASAFFSCLLQSKHNMNNSFFLDRNPRGFDMMLDYLRYGSGFPMHLEMKELHLLLVEAFYWSIQQLAEELMRFLENSGPLEIYGLDLSGRDFSEWNIRRVNFIKCNFDESSFDNAILSGVAFVDCSFQLLTGSQFPKQIDTSQFRDLDLSGVLLKDQIFSHCQFENISFPSNVTDVSFKNCDVTTCDFTNNVMSEIRFVDCNLAANQFPEDLSACDFSGSSLSGLDLSELNTAGAKLTRCKMELSEKLPQDISAFDFTGRDLSGYDFTKHRIAGGNFTGSNMKKVILPADVSACNFSNCDFSSTDFSSCTVRRAVFNGSNLTGVKFPTDLQNCDFSQCDLSNRDFSTVNFFRANLSGVNLSNTNLSKANLSGANLTGSKLEGTQLPKDLSDCILVHCDLSDRDFSAVNLSGANLSDANLSNTNLSDANLSGANLSGANLKSTNLTRSKLESAQFPKDLSDCILVHCDLSDRDFSTVNFFRANLSGVNLTGANLAGAKLKSTNLTRSKLESAQFPKDLSDCILVHCDLSDRDFSAVNLSDANLSNTNLSGANLSGANLSNTNLSGAKFSGAKLSGANLSGANLSGANLTKMILSPSTQAEHVQTDLFRNSKLLSLQEKLLLQKWAKCKVKQLLYRASSHGDDAATFHQKCDGKGPTFVIIQCSKGNLFGGFASESWHSNNCNIRAPGSFLFSLRNPHNGPPTAFALNNDQDSIGGAMYGYSYYGPTFGNGYDICISNKCSYKDSFTGFPRSYADSGDKRGAATFTGAEKFQVREVEVFSCS